MLCCRIHSWPGSDPTNDMFYHSFFYYIYPQFFSENFIRKYISIYFFFAKYILLGIIVWQGCICMCVHISSSTLLPLKWKTLLVPLVRRLPKQCDDWRMRVEALLSLGLTFGLADEPVRCASQRFAPASNPGLAFHVVTVRCANFLRREDTSSSVMSVCGCIGCLTDQFVAVTEASLSNLGPV